MFVKILECMKIFQFKYIVFFVALIALAGCKDDDNESVEDFKAENRKALGSSGADILSSDIYQSITVELVYSAGFRPEQSTITDFENFLAARINKPGGINIIETQIEAPDGAPFTTQEIRDIEDENRTQYTEGDDIAVYVFFSNGSNSNDTNTAVTLGTAYQNTSIVVYERTLRNLSTSQNIELALLESTTLQHEFGHLFGLVNILDDDIHTDHEDTDNNRHCIVEDCLMYFESNLGRSNMETILNNLRGRQNVPEFDSLCIGDLQAKGGK